MLASPHQNINHHPWLASYPSRVPRPQPPCTASHHPFNRRCTPRPGSSNPDVSARCQSILCSPPQHLLETNLLYQTGGYLVCRDASSDRSQNARRKRECEQKKSGRRSIKFLHISPRTFSKQPAHYPIFVDFCSPVQTPVNCGNVNCNCKSNLIPPQPICFRRPYLRRPYLNLRRLDFVGVRPPLSNSGQKEKESSLCPVPISPISSSNPLPLQYRKPYLSATCISQPEAREQP
ncbi:hypothetical protein FPQ18DRAFT_85075 [Pyronema domesticum]|nr:hypothetical protein FPQ18DRAFT_85075 [Pyronema domesticum]